MVLASALLAGGCGPSDDTAPKETAEQLPGGGGPAGGSAFHNVHYRDQNLTDEGFAKWLGEQDRVGLIQLDFSGNKLTAASVEALAKVNIGSVYTLQLSRNPIGDEGVELIAKHKRSEELGNLYLDHIGMTDRGAVALAASPNVASLLYLAVGGNELTAAGIA
ncbi:MAG: hypothetical protein JRF63_15125, partial [Deltaproteobacteria bacterium]|nr:hypothetical protein [Deltaproteobacteria bacterium]